MNVMKKNQLPIFIATILAVNFVVVNAQVIPGYWRQHANLYLQ